VGFPSKVSGFFIIWQALASLWPSGSAALAGNLAIAAATPSPTSRTMTGASGSRGCSGVSTPGGRLYISSSSSVIGGKDGIEEGDRSGGQLPQGEVPPPDPPTTGGAGGPRRNVGVAGVSGLDRGRGIRLASCWISFFAPASSSSNLRARASLRAAQLVTSPSNLARCRLRAMLASASYTSVWWRQVSWVAWWIC
jgi:hypothetical protein